ncbi:hypothetical protein RE474_06645 [Methanolobus sediminis]|uniref:DUF2238 domain-containing protein n=1 Tax=Methanolobus sediminis TaxID=3072978 RepID=A0AA51YKA4_9EURY|nr:hypothetical protein [Methanolobus sediminis]WMW26380.1 hypothetical protein RE474_06645 [Methanolobus sediminis]
MVQIDKLRKILKNTSLNAFVGWTMILLLALLGIGNFIYGRFMWTILIAFVISIIITPAIRMRKLSVMPSWYFIFLVILPIVGSSTAWYFFSTSIPFYVSVATIALLLAAEINWFTSVKMTYKFAILLVIVTTLAISGLWHLIEWLLDIYLGTSYLLSGLSPDAINDAVMQQFIYATIAGVAAGVLFGWYFMSAGNSYLVDVPTHISVETDDYITHRPPAPIRRLLGISDKTQVLAVRMLQGGLILLLLFGILRKDLSTTINATTGLILTFVPHMITRKYHIKQDTGLVLWLTLAIFLHTIGTFEFYNYIDNWDHVTHALSASVVAAAGYTLIRAIDIYVDEIYIPPRVLFIFILIFVLAMGVIWEIIEFLSDELTSTLGYNAILAQHGIGDTMLDLVFDLLGAILAATWGTAYLSNISYRLADKFEELADKKNAR